MQQLLVRIYLLYSSVMLIFVVLKIIKIFVFYLNRIAFRYPYQTNDSSLMYLSARIGTFYSYTISNNRSHNHKKNKKRGFSHLSPSINPYKQNSFFNLCIVLTLTPSSLDTIFIGQFLLKSLSIPEYCSAFSSFGLRYPVFLPTFPPCHYILCFP